MLCRSILPSLRRLKALNSIKDITLMPSLMARLSTSVQMMSNMNKPRKSGDKGPGKNYQKKMLKRANKEGDDGTVDIARTLIERLRTNEGEEESSLTEKETNMRNVLSGFQFTVGKERNLDMKRRQKEINKLLEEGDSPTLHYKVKQTMRPINFMNPNSGMRLGVFNSFDARKEVMPSRKPNLTEQDKQKELEEIRLLQSTSYFQDLIMGNGVPYPRQFPVDNENYEHEESDVNFKDHVLLDHLIKDFPARGPVRHFMELVVTGLSMNPDYSVKEKRDFIDWYKEYFSKFSPEELQTIYPDDIPKYEAKKDDEKRHKSS